ncbi:AraC family transcriptional regulator [Apibacter raozihei]|uniref:helix-turn-helix domain-containing protein n=1 Tax=Apibacter TaxID=1778601 RepID=UPI0015F2CFB3|nr:MULTISPECIES: AraC family transcriptional regulator [Apibacter]
MELFIKNMVCNRCILVVKNLTEELDLAVLKVEMGKITLKEKLDKNKTSLLKNHLEELGFELLDDNQQKLIEKIKTLIINHIQNLKDININFSELISQSLAKDYSYLSKLFSATEGLTIEHYTILQKIEKVKELLTYDELTLSEISYQLGYSSVAHLSSQFKKVTGLTPSQFKSQGIKLRKPLDKI